MPLRLPMRASLRPLMPRRQYSVPTAQVVAETAVEKEGFFSSIVTWGASMLESFHVAAGLPYWGVIIVSTVGFRILLTPLMVASLKNAAIMQRIKPQIDILQARFRKAGGPSNPPAAKRFKEDYDELSKREGFSMGKSFLPVIAQMPGFVFFFTSIRRMLETNPNISSGGALWFNDLSASDPYMRLNLMTSAVMFLSFRMGAESGAQPENQRGMMKALAIIFPILYIPLTMSFGQGLHLFWFAGAAGAIGVNYVLRFTVLGQLMGVPPRPSKALTATVPDAIFSSRRSTKTASQLKREHLAKHSSKKSKD